MRDWLNVPQSDLASARCSNVRREGTDHDPRGFTSCPPSIAESWAGMVASCGIVLHCEVERIESGCSHENQHLPYGIPISCRHGSHPGDSGRSRRPSASAGGTFSRHGHEQAVERIEGWLNQAYHAR